MNCIFLQHQDPLELDEYSGSSILKITDCKLLYARMK